MASKNVNLSTPDVLCEYAPLDTFKEMMKNRIGVGPDLMAMLIRDGKVAHVGQGAHLQIGGFWTGIKEAVFGGHALKLLIADLKPFSVTGAFAGVTRDNAPVHGEATLELQVNPEAPEGVLAFASDAGATPKSDVFARLAPHLSDRVIGAILKQVDALDLRGDRATQDKIQAEIMKEAERVLGDLGVQVNAVSVNWAFNEAEIAEIEKRAAEREQEMLDARFENLAREIKRTAEITELEVKTDLSGEKLKAASDAELRQMLLAQELDFADAEASGQRVARMKALEADIAETKLKQQTQFELAISAAKSDVELRRVKADVEALDLKSERLRREQEVALKRLEERAELESDREARRLQLDSLAEVQNLDLERKDRETSIGDRSKDAQHARDMDLRRQSDDTDLAKLRLKREMSADQILAEQAGLSPDVAAIFAERAKTDAEGAAEKTALMERLIESGAQTGEQAKYFFEQFKEGVVGVAAGAGGGSAPAKAMITCPRCRAENPADKAFCGSCAAPLRT